MDFNWLDNLGPCFVSNLPDSVLEKITADDILRRLQYFQGVSFQPTKKQMFILQNKLGYKYN